MSDFNFGEQFEELIVAIRPSSLEGKTSASPVLPIDPVSQELLKRNIKKLSPELNRVQSIAFKSGDTSFEVRNSDSMNLSSSVAVSISTILNGYDGQLLTLLFEDFNITLVHDASGARGTINLGGTNFVSAPAGTLVLISDGQSWSLAAGFQGTLITVYSIAYLQNAINSLSAQGGGIVSLAPGTYSATSSFTIPSNVTVNGNGSTIDFGNGAYQFLIQGTNAYSTGTLTATFGSAAIVGVGTTWTAGMIGQSILIGEYWYTIATRTDNTHITISTTFKGTNLSGDTYVIATTVNGAALENITLQNSTVSLLKARYCNLFTADSVTCISGDKGFDYQDSANMFILAFTIDTCATNGIYLNNSPFMVVNNGLIINSGPFSVTRTSNTAFEVFSIQAATGVGLSFTNCHDVGVVNYAIVQSISHGIEFVSGNNDIQVVEGEVDTAGGDGIKLTASSDRITLAEISLLNCTGYGINIASSTCDNNVINTPGFNNNTSGNINDSGTGTVTIPSRPIFQQILATTLTTATPSAVGTAFITGSNTDGSVMWVYESSAVMKRYARDANTGMYYVTHVINPTKNFDGQAGQGCIINIGIYIYIFGTDGLNMVSTRFLAADLTGETNMTVPVISNTSGSVQYTDGTFAYVVSYQSATTNRKWSVSGTTFTAVDTATCVDLSGANHNATLFDGTNVYIFTDKNLSTSYVIKKLNDIRAATVATTTLLTNNAVTSNYSDSPGAPFIIPIDSTKIYIGFCIQVYNQAAQYTVNAILIPFTKP